MLKVTFKLSLFYIKHKEVFNFTKLPLIFVAFSAVLSYFEHYQACYILS